MSRAPGAPDFDAPTDLAGYLRDQSAIVVASHDPSAAAAAAVAIGVAASARRRVAIGDLTGDAEAVYGLAGGEDAPGLAESFRDGWFYPGDLASLDADGFVTLRGRVKDMIIRGGVNIFPGDVEKVLIEHPGVSDAAVVGTPSRDLGEELVAFVVSPQNITREELIAHCQGRLAPYKQPREVRVVGSLPRTALGKVTKHVLREQPVSDAEQAPSGPSAR